MLVKCLDKYRKSQLDNEELANLIWAHFLTEKGWHLPLTEEWGRLETARRLITLADQVLYSGDRDPELKDFSPTAPITPPLDSKKRKKKSNNCCLALFFCVY